MAGIGKQLRGSGRARVGFAKGGKAFPDLNKDGKVSFKDVLIGRGVVKKSKGGYVDMSEEHEGMESKAEEAREYAMEEKGYEETKSGKMKIADMLTAKMSKKKKGKIMKGKR